MGFTPFSSIPVGVSDTTQINAPIAGLNTLLAGLGQSASAASSTSLVATTTDTDVPGCSITVTVAGANAFALVTMVFDVQAFVTTTGNVFLGRLKVDGSGGFPEAHADDRTGRITTSQTMKVPLPAGSHTLKLQAALTPAGGFTVMPSHTNLTVTLFDIV